MEALYRQFVNAAPVKVNLEFGVNDNIVLRAVSIERRLHQGTEIKRNTFMTFTQVNPVTRKAIKEHEYSFFNLNHESEYVVQNMRGKLTKLVAIIKALGIDPIAAEKTMEDYLEKYGVTDDLAGTSETLKGAALIDQGLSAGFYEVIKEHVGLDGKLMNFKTTVDKKGYLEIPLYGEFIDTMISGVETKLRLTVKEVQAKNTAMETKVAGADKLGKSPKIPGAKGGIDLKNLNFA